MRNKYCATFQKDANKKQVCFKNWEEASSSMETDIILELASPLGALNIREPSEDIKKHQ